MKETQRRKGEGGGSRKREKPQGKEEEDQKEEEVKEEEKEKEYWSALPNPLTIRYASMCRLETVRDHTGGNRFLERK